MQSLSVALFLVVSVALSCIVNEVHAEERRGCPKAEDILPCTCEQIDITMRPSITCHHLNTPDALREIFERNRNLQFWRLNIAYSSLSYIPSSIFETARFFKLYVDLSSLDTLFDNPPSSETLDFIAICNVTLRSEVDWRSFSNLTLKLITLHNITVREIGQSFWDSIPKTLLNFHLYDSNITSIQPQTFENFEKKIKNIHISFGLLTELDYNIFPKTIESITLDNHSIETLPDGIFDYLPNLESVALRGNLLNTIKREVFANIESVYLEGNPIICDCRIKWVLETKNIEYTKCAGPENLKGKLVKNLTEDDFRYCESFANNEIV